MYLAGRRVRHRVSLVGTVRPSKRHGCRFVHRENWLFFRQFVSLSVGSCWRHTSLTFSPFSSFFVQVSSRDDVDDDDDECL